MIGGYLYSRVDESIEKCLQNEQLIRKNPDRQQRLPVL